MVGINTTNSKINNVLIIIKFFREEFLDENACFDRLVIAQEKHQYMNFF